MANRYTRIDALQIKDLSITNAQIATDAAIALSKLAVGGDGNIIVGASGTGVPTYVAVSGDITMDNLGATTIGANKVTAAMIRLANAGNLRARNADDDGDVNIFNLTSGDVMGLPATEWANAIVESTLKINNGPVDGRCLKYVSSGSTMTWADPEGATGFVTPGDFIANQVPATGSIDGNNRVFTISNTPKDGTLQVSLNGLQQNPGVGGDYTLLGNTVTFAVGLAPEVGDFLLFTYVK